MHGYTSGTPLQYLIVDRLGASFYWTGFKRRLHCYACTAYIYDRVNTSLFDNNVPSDNSYSDLSDHSALEIRVSIRVRLRVALFQHFSRRITKTSTLSSANFTEGNILLKERTQKINNLIKLHILGMPMNTLCNWLMWRYIVVGAREKLFILLLIFYLFI